jgi:hypothetical protein
VCEDRFKSFRYNRRFNSNLVETLYVVLLNCSIKWRVNYQRLSHKVQFDYSFLLECHCKRCQSRSNLINHLDCFARILACNDIHPYIFLRNDNLLIYETTHYEEAPLIITQFRHICSCK